MSLRVQRVPSVKYKLLTAAVAAFALIAQPMYGFVAGQVASAASLSVCASGCAYSTIQSAITAADSGDTVTVAAGSYNEAVTVNKSVTLQGAKSGINATTRTIDGAGESILGGGSQTVLTISANNVKIDGFQVAQNGTGAHTINTTGNFSGITLENNIVTRTGTGSAMHLHGGQNFTIQKNYFSNIAGQGIVLRNGNQASPVATNQKIIDNEFEGVRAMTGGAIVVYGQSGLEIARNNITTTFQGISIGATGPAYYNMHNVSVHDNTVNLVLDDTQPNVYRYGLLVEGNGDGVVVKNNSIKQSGVTPTASTRYALVRVSYNETSAAVANPTGLVITENDLVSDAADRYILVGQNVTNQITASKNWWGSQANPASKVTSPTATVVSSPWLCQPVADSPTESNNGSCVPPNATPTTTLQVNGQDNATLVGNKFTVSGLAEDDVALNRVYVQLVNRQDNKRYGGTTINLIGKGATANWSHTYDATALNLPEGKYAAHVSVTDMTGKSGTAGWTSNFVLDKTAPAPATVTVNGSSAATVYTNQYNMTANWTVPGGDAVRYEYVYWNDISASVYNASNPWVKPTTSTTHGGAFDQGKGNHYIKVRAFDAAGNTSESNTTKVVYETTAPTTSISEVKQTGDVVKVTGSVNDANLNYYYCYLTTNQTIVVNGTTYTNGQEVRLGADSTRNAACNTTWANGRTSISGELGGFNVAGVPTGSYTVNLVAYDKAGNNNASNPEKYPFDIDKTAPSATVNVTTSNNVATATLSGVNESIKNVAGWTQAGGVWTREHTANGSYFVTIEDLAGNPKTINYSVNSIDDVPPAVAVTSVVRNNNGTYTLTGTTSDASDSVSVSINGAPALSANVTGTTTWQFITQQLTDGLYTVAVTSVDEFGNSGSLSPVYAFTAVAPFMGGGGLDEESELIVTDLSGVPGAGPVGVGPQTFAAATLDDDASDEYDTAILGAQTKGVDKTAATPAIEATESGWKIFGLAWYWWLLILAAIAAIWWAIAGYRRRHDEA